MTGVHDDDSEHEHVRVSYARGNTANVTTGTVAVSVIDDENTAALATCTSGKRAQAGVLALSGGGERGLVRRGTRSPWARRRRRA